MMMIYISSKKKGHENRGKGKLGASKQSSNRLKRSFIDIFVVLFPSRTDSLPLLALLIKFLFKIRERKTRRTFIDFSFFPVIKNVPTNGEIRRPYGTAIFLRYSLNLSKSVNRIVLAIKRIKRIKHSRITLPSVCCRPPHAHDYVKE